MTTIRIGSLGAARQGALFLLAVSFGAASLHAQGLQILVPPTSQTNPPGFTVFFSVGAENATSYQWYFNGQRVSGPNYVVSNEVLTVISAQPTNVGSYTVLVGGSGGSIGSVPVTLTLSNVPTQTPVLEYSVLASFNKSTTGAFPQTGVVQGSDGFLYGTTLRGGINHVSTGGDGTVFKMSTNGTFAWSFSFNNADGYAPAVGLAQAPNGMFYGTTAEGGLYGMGTVFSISPSGVFSNLFSFTNNTDGGIPQGALCAGSDGFLYGDTSTNGSGDLGGTIFKMTTNGNLVWSFLLTTSTGDVPLAGLVQATNGYFYGTTSAGGTNGYGTVFQISGNEVFSNLYSFTGGTNGGAPAAPLVPGADGSLYGTTQLGGFLSNDLDSDEGVGTIFKITTNGLLTTLVAFDGTNGMTPQAGLFLAGDGNFYGTTSSGGAEFPLDFGASFQLAVGYPDGFGTIYQLTPQGALNTIFSFNGNFTGAFPHSALWQGTDGGLYGATANGGTNDLAGSGDGVVFRLDVPAPRLQSATRLGSTFSFSWDAVIGEPYQTQYKDNLSQTNWVDLGGPVFGTNGVASQFDTIGATNAHRFYRVLLQY